MNTELFDELEDDLRAALHAVVPHLLDDEPADHLPHHATAPSFVRTTVGGPDAVVRQRSRVGTMAAALVLLLGTGAAVLAFGRHDPGAASTPTGATGASPSTVDCSQGVCVGFDPLPLAEGVGNYYVGSPDLGEPTINRNVYDRLIRCAELNTAFTACARVEGAAGLNVVSYPASATDPTATIDIGTVYAEASPAQYAAAWGPTQGGGVTSPVIVQGHEGVRYLNEDRPAAVWTEAPGVLVWVAVPAPREAELLTIAEGVRQSPSHPRSIPSIVQVRLVGVTVTPPAFAHTPPIWSAQDNNGSGLFVGRSGDVECVGYDFIKSCGQSINDRTFLRTTRANDNVTDETVVAGATPSNVASVLVTLADGHSVSASTVTFANYASRFFDIEIAGAQVSSVDWLDANGQTVATMARSTGTTAAAATTLPPVNSPPAIVGTNTGCGLYVLAKGDTPAAVAQRFGVTLEALRQANADNPNFDFFYLGLQIRIPLPADSVPCPPTT
jgi:LysM repeat protein